jgi:hypothetical protein
VPASSVMDTSMALAEAMDVVVRVRAVVSLNTVMVPALLVTMPYRLPSLPMKMSWLGFDPPVKAAAAAEATVVPCPRSGG